MITQTTFHPEKTNSRFAYVKKIVSIAAILTLGYFLHSLRHPYRQSGFIWNIIIPVTIGAIGLIFILRSKIINSITVDLKTNELIVSYLTISKNETIRTIPFSDITYEYKLMPSRYGDYTLLIISVNYKKEIFLKEGGDGWSLETIENLHSQLESSNIF